MVSWKEQQKIIEDLQQCFLKPDLTITKNNYRFAKKQPKVEFDKVVLCPFCLMSYVLDKFVLRKGLRVCPNCGCQLKFSTLSEINDLDRFVKFVFNYRFSGFWSKICLDVKPITDNTRFNTWNNRLYSLGLSRDFWDKYKLLKGDFEEDE